MILTCPSCGTQYVVKDGAIPPGGRQVRCASCKHSWHQNPDEEDEAADLEPGAEMNAGTEAAPAAAEQVDVSATEIEEQEPEADDSSEESFTEATLIEPRSGPEAEERAFEEATMAAPPPHPMRSAYADSKFDITKRDEVPSAARSDWGRPPPVEPQDDGFTAYTNAEPEEESPRGRGVVKAVLIIVVAIVLIAAAFWFLAPASLKAKLGLGAPAGSSLALVTEHMDRQRLQSGNELLTVTGRVINQTTKAQDVPPLQAQLKTARGKLVYSWTIDAPTPTLAPGASASFNSAQVNVPPGGDELTITVGAQQAG